MPEDSLGIPNHRQHADLRNRRHVANTRSEVHELGSFTVEKNEAEGEMAQGSPGLWRAVIATFYFFMPPPLGASERSARKWQHRVAASLAGIIIFCICFVLAALGNFPTYWLGFASAHDLRRDEDQWRLVRLEILDTKLFDTRGRQCAAIINKNQAALRSETERLQEKLVEYQILNSGIAWRTPDCTEY